MSGVDLFTAACGLGMLSTSALAIWATWSRGVALDRLRKANERAERARAAAEQWSDEARCLEAAGKRAKDYAGMMRAMRIAHQAYRDAEPARIAAAIADHQRAHMKRISVLGNQSAKRRKREG